MNFIVLKIFSYTIFLLFNYFLLFDSYKSIWMVFVFLLAYFYEGVLFNRLDNITETYRIVKANIISLLTIAILSLFIKLKISNIEILEVFIMNFSIIFYIYILKKLIFKIPIFREKVIMLYDLQTKENIKTWFPEDNVFGYDIEYEKCIENLNYSTVLELEEKIDKLRVNSAIISVKNTPFSKLTYLINKIHPKLKNILLFPDINFIFMNTNIVSSFQNRNFGLNIKNNLLLPANIFLKSWFDFVFSFLIMIFILPIFLVLYIAIIIFDKTNPIFKQERIGKNGEIFIVYKFKTMVNNADVILKEYLSKNPIAKQEYEKYKKLKNDPRVTKIGAFLRKTSLDELPQFFNVLKGEMSVIGPRPYLVEEKADMGKFYDYYIKVKPGITGLWQVSGRNELSFKERIKLDTWYIKNWSFEIDFMILLKTIHIVISRKGSY